MKKLLIALLVCCLLCSCMAVSVWAEDADEIELINTTGDCETIVDKLNQSKMVRYTDEEQVEVKLTGPAYIVAEYLILNSEQVAGQGSIPMPYAINYEIVVNGKIYDNHKPTFVKEGGEEEHLVLHVTPAAFENSTDGTYTVTVRFRASMYPNVTLAQLGQKWHASIVILPEIVEEKHVHVDADKDNFCDGCEVELYVDRAWDASAGKVVETLKEIPADAEPITSGTYSLMNGKTYVASGEVTVSDVLGAYGTADDPAILILKDDCVLTASCGINVSVFNGQPFALTICGQANDNGQLYTYGDYYAPGIGSGYDMDCGIITINGGTVYAEGANYAAGIGGACYGSNGTVTINGGIVTANSGAYAAGIGGGSYGGAGGTVTINGGNVTAIGFENQAVGFGWGGTDNGTLTVNGEYVIKSGFNADDAQKTTLADYTDARTEYVWIHYHNLIDGKCACGLRADGLDYAALDAALAVCVVEIPDVFTTSSYSAYIDALDYALCVNSAAENQEQIDTAAADLYDAFYGLELALDYSVLDDALSNCTVISGDFYTTSSYAAYCDAYDYAKAVMGSAELQDDIDNAASDLLDAFDGLELRADLSGLDEALDAAYAVDMDGWTKASAAALENAVYDGECIMAVCDEFPASRQDDADAAAAAIWNILNRNNLKIDTTALEAAISNALNANEDEYSAEVWAELQNKLAKANDYWLVQDLLAVDYQGDLDIFKDSIIDLLSKKVGPADYSDVDAAIAAWDELWYSGEYTEESVMAVEDAIADVSRGLNANYQDEVDAMAAAIWDAIDKLEPVAAYSFDWIYGRKMTTGSAALRKAPSYTENPQYASTGIIPYIVGETDAINIGQFDRYTSACILWLDENGKVIAYSASFKSGVDVDVNYPACNGTKKGAVAYIITVTLAQTAAKGAEAFETVAANSRFAAVSEPEPDVAPVFVENGFGWVYGQKVATDSVTLRKAPAYSADAQYATSGIIKYVEGETDVVNIGRFDRYTSARVLWIDEKGKVIAYSAPFRADEDVNVNTPACNGNKKGAVGYIITVTLAQTAAKGEEAFETVAANSRFVTPAKKTVTYVVHYVVITGGELDTKYVTDVEEGTVVTEYAKAFDGYMSIVPDYEEFIAEYPGEGGDDKEIFFYYMPFGSFR